MQSNGDNSFLNLGVVPSISNCSSSTNLLLRIGLTNKQSDNFKKKLNELPTIFQFAQRAGYKTYLLDAQAAEGQMQNNLSEFDRKAIDGFVTLSRRFIPNGRDNEILKKLIAIMDKKDDEKRFIVVVKWGAHWPYALTYRNEVFKPAARKSFTEMNEKNKEKIFNAYFNSLRFSVDEFLQKLTAKSTQEDEIIFYTSDHGQMLYLNDNPLTHCHEWQDDMKGLPMDEFKVPLIVFSKSIKDRLQKPQQKQMAQEQIFPTTLALMGYGQKVTNNYGPTLFEGAEEGSVKVNIMMTGRQIQYRP